MVIRGAFRLFQVRGINLLEYLALFGLVLLHEFGHALACRSVGGQANTILLWPLGGVALVSPPPRPGTTLWCLAAGPLVNVVLVFVFLGIGLILHMTGALSACPDLGKLFKMVALINVGLLIFNLLPIYPLDGGQILRALLWFFLGPSTSLIAVAIIGFVGVGMLVLLAVVMQSIWFGILSAFILLSCWRGLQLGLAQMRMAKAPRRTEFACPGCGAAPHAYPFWMCPKCRTKFDTFATGAHCPQCGLTFDLTRCTQCGNSSPMNAWRLAPPPLPGAPILGA